MEYPGAGSGKDVSHWVHVVKECVSGFLRTREGVELISWRPDVGLERWGWGVGYSEGDRCEGGGGRWAGEEIGGKRRRGMVLDAPLLFL